MKLASVLSRIVRPGVMTAKLRTPSRREVLDRRGQDVGLADTGRGIDDGLERRRLAVDLEVLGDLEDDALKRLLVRLAQVEPSSDRCDAV